MILVLADRRDQPAQRLVENWRAHDARLLTLADLSIVGWSHHIGDAGAEIAVASGERIPVSAIDGVVTRVAAVMPGELAHVVEADRPYVAAEMNAFLTGWLSQLSCPVINRPTTNSLMGAPHASEGWIAVAARAGLKLPWKQRMYPVPVEDVWPPGAVTVSVLGDRWFGDVEPALAEQACGLAACARVELLAVTFSHAGAGATFVGAHVWPDISVPELAAALLARFVAPSDSRLELASGVAEACA